MKLRSFPGPERYRELCDGANVVPVCAEILADMETPVSVLSRFSRQGADLFLLESVEGGEHWGRYSFLGVSAHALVRVYREHVEVEKQGRIERIDHGGKPLDVLRGMMNRYTPARMPELPRFWGGLVGYLTYEMVSFFEKIPNNLPEERAIASFMVPDALILFDNIRNSLTCMVLTFPGEGDDPVVNYNTARRRLDGMIEDMVRFVAVPSRSGSSRDLTLRSAVNPDEFRSRVEETKKQIVEGDIIQCVISQPFRCAAPEDPIALYRAQRYINPSPYMFFMQLDDTVLVGSSPETMVRLENGVACLRPIAGTRHRGENEQEDRALADELLADEKERAEHLMLVDLGRHELGRIARTGTVQVTDLMIIERYSHVMHLVSNIVADIDEGKDAFDLLSSGFPAGTLSGAPKVRAMEIIAEQEKEPRGPYGGAVGYISFDGNMDFAITIRTAVIEGDTLTCRAGAGIVADSDPERERIETVNKAKSIQKALQLMAQAH